MNGRRLTEVMGGAGGKDQWVGGGGKDGSGVEGRAGGCQCAIVAIKSDGASGTGHMSYLLERTSSLSSVTHYHHLSSSNMCMCSITMYNYLLFQIRCITRMTATENQMMATSQTLSHFIHAQR